MELLGRSISYCSVGGSAKRSAYSIDDMKPSPLQENLNPGCLRSCSSHFLPVKTQPNMPYTSRLKQRQKFGQGQRVLNTGVKGWRSFIAAYGQYLISIEYLDRQPLTSLTYQRSPYGIFTQEYTFACFPLKPVNTKSSASYYLVSPAGIR